MPFMRTEPKDPSEVLDYTIDWNKTVKDDNIGGADPVSEWFLPSNSSVQIRSEGGPGSTHTQKTTTIWLTGGNEGDNIPITNRIHTTGGRVHYRTFLLSIRKK
jgi:hypothetical protein